jgi:ABC-type branched-subunit amino acid transport system substrate-binding protein
MVEVFVEDDQTTPQGAISAYNKMVGIHGVDAVIGGLFDFTAQPLLALAERDQIVFISPINFIIDGSFEMNDYTFVMYPRFEDVVQELNGVIAQRDINSLAMLRYESSFGESIQNTLSHLEDSKGIETFTVETYKEIGASDFRTNILKLQDSHPDAIFLDMLDFDIIKYIKEAAVLGFDPSIIGYTTMRDLFSRSDFDTNLLNGAIMLDWEVPSSNFVEMFNEVYQEKPRRGGNKSYDAIYVLSEAIAQDLPVNGYLEKTTFSTPNTLSLKFTEEHGAESTPIKIYEVVDGEFVEIGR